MARCVNECSAGEVAGLFVEPCARVPRAVGKRLAGLVEPSLFLSPRRTERRPGTCSRRRRRVGAGILLSAAATARSVAIHAANPWKRAGKYETHRGFLLEGFCEANPSEFLRRERLAQTLTALPPRDIALTVSKFQPFCVHPRVTRPAPLRPTPCRAGSPAPHLSTRVDRRWPTKGVSSSFRVAVSWPHVRQASLTRRLR